MQSHDGSVGTTLNSPSPLLWLYAAFFELKKLFQILALDGKCLQSSHTSYVFVFYLKYLNSSEKGLSAFSPFLHKANIRLKVQKHLSFKLALA